MNGLNRRARSTLGVAVVGLGLLGPVAAAHAQGVTNPAAHPAPISVTIDGQKYTDGRDTLPGYDDEACTPIPNVQYDFAANEIQYYDSNGELITTAHWTEWARISSYQDYLDQQKTPTPTATAAPTRTPAPSSPSPGASTPAPSAPAASNPAASTPAPAASNPATSTTPNKSSSTKTSSSKKKSGNSSSSRNTTTRRQSGSSSSSSGSSSTTSPSTSTPAAQSTPSSSGSTSSSSGHSSGGGGSSTPASTPDATTSTPDQPAVDPTVPADTSSAPVDSSVAPAGTTVPAATTSAPGATVPASAPVQETTKLKLASQTLGGEVPDNRFAGIAILGAIFALAGCGLVFRGFARRQSLGR